jgi:hypothetical protein
MNKTMKFFGGVNFRSLVVATFACSSLLFTACEKETASALNPELGTKNKMILPSLSLQDELLIKQATQLLKN